MNFKTKLEMYTNFIQLISTKKIIFILLLFLFVITSKASSTDSLFIQKYNKFIYYNSDSIFSKYVQKGYIETIDDMSEYYEDVLSNLPENKRNMELAKMRRIAKTYKNENLENEAEFLSILFLPEEDIYELNYKVFRIENIVDKADRDNNILMKLRGMEFIFELYWRSMEYGRAFRQLYALEKVLQNVTEEDYPDKGRLYARIGEAYYSFRDYDKAVPYLRKALKPAKHYFDRSSLQAKNTLGSYYNLIGKIDSAEYYFRLAYNSHDKVKSRSKYDALALSNLGHSFVKRKEYDKAIPYFQAGLSRLLIDQDFKLASNVVLGLAHCYLEKGDMKKAKQFIDSSFIYINQSQNDDLYHSLYPLTSKYYSRIGDKKLSEAYFDSTIVANKRYQDKYSSMIILRTEQELFEAERIAREEEILLKEENYRSSMSYSILIIFFISLGLLFLIILYRKNRKAYQALVLRNQDWAETNTVFEKTNTEKQIKEDGVSEPDEEDINLMRQVHDLIKNEKIFKDLDLTLDSLSKQMNINRNYLSKAINKTTGRNFNTYINEYRIKEAIKIMSDEKSDLISIDAIALEVGFGNRTSFYQAFKKITGLSPSDFRNNKVKQSSN